ncbi:ComF family protein [Thermithiobacillus plumbiphilus]|uniref:ComF family protein n=1 Tax=Thermithiobacillus plumbiphilus TaxID=1729899 RepID=A0ABU9D9K1_9PROT
MLNFLYPARCLLCHLPGRAICQDCLAALPRLPRIRCPQCAVPHTGLANTRCARCQLDPPPFSACTAAFSYAAPLDQAIHQWKYHGRLVWTRVLAESWLETVGPLTELPEALLPVPLHWRRLASRGFNQAGLLARHWGRALDIPVLYHYAKRLRHTRQHARLGRSERLQDSETIFQVRPLPVRHVAIIDDVLTTGGTVSALARAALTAGAERVDVWVLARTLHPHT